ncbi:MULTISPECIES: TauD/TfdA dioxygenase family protein [Rhodococcus]|uniref:Taurine dioxygenase n=1 Tax=Rhodococcus opacus RKJ300 = JCM 13270 TaxID=1165867 RepID=I0WXR7_RHOOP|nr:MULTISPECIES: TauD/TfdA family dioxygenase [Rhodococcus]ELB90896.1 taurine dioxygenase [Rhodococcus wratislaviensis IFP 2016]NHU45217.1 taurine dioxygenase [Rhodococcus sp. A14]EID81183.1 taurine dioxygenase [Rhodococcus opacus RKJ300 = JCM 13270]MBA8960923.1 taurine dioxygenase [Rhodococcus opacus]MBP2203211.1 taurine dioxygenase [Rhodococcus opacus]
MTDTAQLTYSPEPHTILSPSGSFRFAPLTCSIGAELFDVNLGDAARDDALFAELRELLLEYKVLFLRDQDMSRAEHVALAERFGPLEDHPAVGSDPDHPGLVQIYKDLDSPAEHYENAFHCDATWRENPPMGCVLRCVETPPIGGDTIWVNMALAYEKLPEQVKKQIDGLRARHSIEASFGAAQPPEQRQALHERFPDAEHPVVRTHPETGEKILFVNAFATHFVNYHTPEHIRYGIDYAPGSSNLLNYLISQASIPEYQVRWRWTKNSVAIWDNRSTQHYAVQDYWPAVRKMERAGIIGDRPF